MRTLNATLEAQATASATAAQQDATTKMITIDALKTELAQAKTQVLEAAQDAAIAVREKENVIKEQGDKIAELEGALGVDIGKFEHTIEAQKVGWQKKVVVVLAGTPHCIV